MKRLKHLWLLLVLSTSLCLWGADGAPTEIRKVEVFPAASEVRVEITLTSVAVPLVETAQHPDRLVVKLPGTTSAPQQKRIAVQQYGVHTVRFGLNHPNPPETDLVVDLDEERPYKVSTNGTKITVIIQPSLREEARRRNAPAAAASKPLLNSLGRGTESGSGTLNSQHSAEGALLTPPPSGPPIQFPQASAPDNSAPSTTASAQPPSARHPNRASLQEGTVFPGAGTPGTGDVPPVSGMPHPTPIVTSGTASTANANATASQPSPATAAPNPQNGGPAAKPVAVTAAQTATPLPTSAPAAPAPSSIASSTTSAPPPPKPEVVASQNNLGAASSVPVNPVPATVAPPPLPSPTPGAPTSTDAHLSVAPPQPGSKELSSNPQSSPGPASSVTANAAQGSAQLQPVPQEPRLSATPSLEAAAPVQPAPETSLPPASGQAVAETAEQTPATPPEPAAEEPPPAETASVEPADGGGSGIGHAAQLIRRESENPDFRTAFRVKYVAQGTAYLDGGRAVGLVEGMKLVVRDLPNAGGVAAPGSDSKAAGDVAELEVLSVAENSAVTEIHQPRRPVKVGDLAFLSAADQQALVEKNALSATRKYPAVVSFTENDTLDEEARAIIPRPPSPAVNRSRGRIGFDYIGVLDHGTASMYTNNVGLVVRTDITRIGGTYWNASGYWRGRFDHTSTGPQTLQDLINRTYHLYTSYENPSSSWVAGFGRMYLPWATSLDTIDGGYAGRRLKRGVTSGIFLGSTPDPTSWSYAPNRQVGGAFLNFEGGSYDDFHYTSTTGGGMDMLSWTPDRPFIFFENGIYYKRVFSIYQASQIDSRAAHVYPCSSCPGGTFTQSSTNWGLGRNFVTVRFSPHPRIEFSVNDTYYRDLPYIDPSTITTAGIAAGLFDKFLSQGVMGGVRVEVLPQVWVNADLGMNSHSGESKNSLNQMFGVTFGRVPWIRAHVDARYSRFNSTFGSGSYEALAVSKNLTEGLQLQLLAGQQNFSSTLTTANQSRFVNGMLESNLGRHYFVQAGGTISRGNQMNYDQWLFTFGYRFDNREGQKGK